ncbi:MAG: Ig-like domain-containing protein [Bacteroidota bacterium]
MKRLFLVLGFISVSLGQDNRALVSAFESAATEFGVPADILKGIAFAETRWQHLEWAEGDTASCMGMPHVYGVMALQDNDFFGHSLRTAAELIHQDPSILKRDFGQNIRGAAALLQKLHNELPLPDGTSPTGIESWQNAIASYCGIPQPELAYQHALDIYKRLAKGYHDFGINLNSRPINLIPIQETVARIQKTVQEHQPQRMAKTTGQPDYPAAHWVPGKAGYYYPEDQGYGKFFVVIHDMEGYYASVVSYFQTLTDGRQVSVHYCVNGLQDSPSDALPGDITQMVEEKYYAWHAVCLNRYSLGIEHEGFVANPAWYTPEMYVASAKLTKYMCDKYSIPKDKNHIVGHNEWQKQSWVDWAVANGYPATFGTCNSHTDPGANWDWEFYLQLVRQDTIPPVVTSTPPAQKLDLYQTFSITFSQRMDMASIQQSFSITPTVTGSLSWSGNYKTVTFTPSTYLTANTSYTVKIDTSAHNYLNRKIDVNGDGIGGEVYTFNFQTVESDTIAPQLVSTYPADNQSLISPSVEIIVNFNEPLDTSTLAQSFELKDDANNVLPISNLTWTSGFGFTKVRLRPAFELQPQSTYHLTINQQAKDFGGNSITTPKTITFVTEAATVFNGTLIDGVNSTGGWMQPSYSGSTTNVNATFSVATDIMKGGTGSGKINYTFTQSSGGYLREHNTSTPSIEGGQYFGAWVYGDNGNNKLEYWFYYGTSGYITIAGPQINWTGWKLKSLQTSLVPVGDGVGGRRFASIGIRQMAGAQLSGTVYFDELTVGNSITETEELPAPQIPTSFMLHQNFPNPFNPSTIIRFDVAAEAHTKLAVFNTLGQQVAVLLDAVRPPGSYAIDFVATGLPSGIYFYRLESGTQIDIKKMILLR